MPVTLRGQMVKTRATDQQALEETFFPYIYPVDKQTKQINTRK